MKRQPRAVQGKALANARHGRSSHFLILFVLEKPVSTTLLRVIAMSRKEIASAHNMSLALQGALKP